MKADTFVFNRHAGNDDPMVPTLDRNDGSSSTVVPDDATVTMKVTKTDGTTASIAGSVVGVGTGRRSFPVADILNEVGMLPAQIEVQESGGDLYTIARGEIYSRKPIA